MKQWEVTLIQMDEQALLGVWMNSNDKTIAGDIASLSRQYDTMISRDRGTVLPYFVLSRNYDEHSGDFELFVGGTLESGGLERFVLPAGEYAKITVRPKFGFLWGVSIGQAKTYFYKKWIPQSPYRALNMEYERHTEESVGKRPSVALLFAVERRA